MENNSIYSEIYNLVGATKQKGLKQPTVKANEFFTQVASSYQVITMNKDLCQGLWEIQR